MVEAGAGESKTTLFERKKKEHQKSLVASGVLARLANEESQKCAGKTLFLEELNCGR